MSFVADDDVGDGANGDNAAVGGSALGPGMWRQIFEHADMRVPDGVELCGECGQGALVGVSELRVVILVEAG